MNDGLLVVIDEWRVPVSSIVPDLVEFARENFDFVKGWLEFLRLGTWFSSEHTKRITTCADECHRVTGCSFPA